MKRKTMALILALSMCLSLLSACGSGNTETSDKPPESESVVSSTDQPEESKKPEESKEQPEESEKPGEDEPEESPEPTQEEPKEEHAGTKLLALLQEEYQNGFFEGEGPRHTYFDFSGRDRQAAIYDGIVYMRAYGSSGFVTSYYDIATKESHEFALTGSELEIGSSIIYFIDGNFYSLDCIAGKSHEMRMYDGSGTLLSSVPQHYDLEIHGIALANGILEFDYQSTGSAVLLSYNLEKIADILAPQQEVEHGQKKDVKLRNIFVADGAVYGATSKQLYRLNTTTYEWEEAGDVPTIGVPDPFFGRYVTRSDGIYDRLTGEQVFEYGELYPVANEYGTGLGYFGGDKYLGKKGDEYRWVNLTDLTMSDPLPFPEGKTVTVLNDTYCVYQDNYGWFLWNYNDGTEETMMTK